MAFAIKGELQGLQSVLAALDKLKQGARNRILRKALTTAAKPMTKTAKELAPRETGLLRKSIGSVTRTNKSGFVMVIIGPRVGFRKEVKLKKNRIFRQAGTRTVFVPKPTDEQLTMVRNPIKYAHLVELGTRYRRAKPFLQPAFDRNRQGAIDTITRISWDEIQKLAARAAAKGKK